MRYDILAVQYPIDDPKLTIGLLNKTTKRLTGDLSRKDGNDGILSNVSIYIYIC